MKVSKSSSNRSRKPSDSKVRESGVGSTEKKTKAKLLRTPDSKLQTTTEPQTMEDLLALEQFAPKGYKRGDVIIGRVSSISGKEVLVDFGGKMEGVVGEKEWDIVKDFVAKLKPGDKVTAVVISPENDRGQMVISIKQAGSKYRWQRAQDLLKSGEAVAVRGVEINKGGLIVEFDSLRGFIPGSQLAGEHQGEMNRLINHPLSVKVIEVDQGQNRLIFSEKAISGAADLAKKLEEVKSKVKIGEKYTGKVSAIMSYGIFVNLEAPAGGDGLVHISEISWSKVDNLGDLFKVGDKVEVLVLGINETDAKLNLSLKQLLPDPWQDLAKKYSLDQEVKGKVTRISPYGVFVQLDPSADGGIEGLIHISKVPAEANYQLGDIVACTIESVDAIAHRISLIPVLKAKPIGYK